MRIAAIFSDHMVLQRDKEGFFFGETDREGTLSVTIDNISIEERVEKGAFSLSMPSHKAGGPYIMTIVMKYDDGSEEEKIINDIYFGEVWIVNGQSNIEFEIQNAEGGSFELETADLPEIRYFKSIKAPVVDDALLEAEKSLHWKPLQNGDFRDMSGVGYFFAKKLHEELNKGLSKDVPGLVIGMVDCYQGGSSISCWLSKDSLLKYPEGKLYMDEFEEAIKGQTEEDYERLLNAYNNLVQEHLEKAAKAKANNPDITPEELAAVAGDYPWPPPAGLKSAFRPCGLYHTMIERIAPFASRGLIYYQGEEDAGRHERYRVLLEELIDLYRESFRDGDLPMVIIQLPMFIGRGAEDTREWAMIRKAQEEAVDSKEGTYLVNLIDCGEYDNVHPVDKKTPGERTAVRVLKDIYGSNEGALEPVFKKVSVIDGGYKIEFENTYGKLILSDNKLIDLRKEGEVYTGPEHIYGFEIRVKCTEDYHPADASISGDAVIIKTTEEVSELRYGFFNYGKVNLYNDRMLPVRPFDYLL